MAFATLAGMATAQERQVRGDLLGRGPGEVSTALHLTGEPAWLPHLGASLDGRALVVVPADTRVSADCPAGVQMRSGDGETYPELFVFLDGQLVTVAKPPRPDRVPIARNDTREARRRPAGPLPLAGGLQAHLDALMTGGFAAEETLILACSPPMPAALAARRPAVQAIATTPFALATLIWFSPYLATRPFEAADRASASREGPGLLATLRPGAPLLGGEVAFRAANRRVARWHGSDDTPDYAVVTIDLGDGRPGSHDFASAGVRAGRVEWVAPQGFPWRSFGLCQDGDRRPGAMRTGCTETRHYRP